METASAIVETTFTRIDVIACPYCGELNESSRVRCRQCETRLDRDQPLAPAQSTLIARPAFVTVYAGLLSAAAVALLIVAFAAQNLSSGPILLVAATAAIIAYGLWRQRGWARYLVIVIQCLNFVFGLILVAAGNNPVGIVPATIGLVLAHWFVVNDQYFK